MSHGLWKTDGTAEGTVLVNDKLNVQGNVGPKALGTVFGDMLLFRASSYATNEASRAGYELWRTDGTAAGTAMIKDIYPGSTPTGIALSSDPNGLTVVGNAVYFSAASPNVGNELWKTNGTAAGTVLVTDILPGSESSNPSSLTAGLGTMLFSADDGVRGPELWRSAVPNRHLVLSAPTGATLSDASGAGTIVDDEGPVTPAPPRRVRG